MFDPAKPVTTRRGSRVEIVAIRPGLKQPIIGLLFDSDGDADVFQWCADGRFLEGHSSSGSDLINVGPVPVFGHNRHVVWKHEGDVVSTYCFATSEDAAAHIVAALNGAK